MAKKKRNRMKTGPRPLGLGPIFSIRLTEAQDKKARTLAGLHRSIGDVVREALAQAWGC